jgi:hypothetical protein
MAAAEDQAGPKAETAPERVALYNSVGDAVPHWEVDVGAATLTKRGTLKLPSTVQYGWPHPSNRFIYVSSTDSKRGSKSITGQAHFLTALRVGQDGALELHGSPRPLRQRPIRGYNRCGSGRSGYLCPDLRPTHTTIPNASFPNRSPRA